MNSFLQVLAIDCPTKEQSNKIDELKQQGYVWDMELSTSYAAVVMRKGNDLWVFGLDGSILHNPDHIVIKV